MSHRGLLREHLILIPTLTLLLGLRLLVLLLLLLRLLIRHRLEPRAGNRGKIKVELAGREQRRMRVERQVRRGGARGLRDRMWVVEVRVGRARAASTY